MPTPDPLQAADAVVFAAGQVRVAQLCEAIIQAKYYGADTKHLVFSVIDLGGGLEQAGRSKDRAERNAIFGYLQERYGLLAIGLDPVWHALFRDVSPLGTTVRPYVLAVNGVVLAANGFVLGNGARLIPNEGPPTFNTRLMPAQTVGAVTFTGDNGDYFEFNMPMNASVGGPQQMFLFVDGSQVAGVDFPADAVGEYFRLNYAGVDYLGMFQIVPTTSRVDLLPE